MAITLARVEALMAGDSRKTLWDSFTTTGLKQQAVTQANRMLTLANGAALTQTESGEDDLKRHDLAVALQALHLLTTGKVIADGTMAGAKHIAGDTGEAPKSAESKEWDAANAIWSREALMYLKGTAQAALPSSTLLIPSSLVMDRG